jgi:hypothetical protein
MPSQEAYKDHVTCLRELLNAETLIKELREKLKYWDTYHEGKE